MLGTVGVMSCACGGFLDAGREGAADNLGSSDW